MKLTLIITAYLVASLLISIAVGKCIAFGMGSDQSN